MSGLFITMEGTDGAGKTTQINRLAQYFEDMGYKVICTREPGGTPISENNTEMTDMTEALLYAAARAQHVEEVILPALKEGDIVISDRFVDSSVVYQGFARSIGERLIKNINKYAVGDLEPDITFFLKLKPEDGLARKREQAELDRLEAEKFSFHQRVYDGYVRLSKRCKNRIQVINALKSVDEIHDEIVKGIENLMEKNGI